jgi:tripartite ATP-independent transporter DctP family solute receptor
MDAAQRPGQTPPKSEAKGMRTRRLVFPAKAGKKPNQCGDKEAEQKINLGDDEMGFSRRSLLKTTAASAVLSGLGAPLIARAQQAEFTYKFANNLPDTHPLNIRAREMAAAIKSETNGRFDLQIFPNNQLGADTDVLSQLRSGGVEFFTMSGLILAILVPAASINGMGFAFPDYPSVWKAMDGELGAYVRKEVAKANIVAFEKIWDNGFRQTTSSTRPITGPADYKGFKIRVPVSPLWTSMFKAFDATPASINFNEVYSALQTKIVEGQENPLALISTAKLYEVQKYCSLTNHMWDGYWFLANRRALEALPPDVRTVVENNVNEAALKARLDTEKLNATVREELSAKGLTFNQPDLAPFRDKLRAAGFYSEWKGKYGDEAWAILERAVGKLS